MTILSFQEHFHLTERIRHASSVNWCFLTSYMGGCQLVINIIITRHRSAKKTATTNWTRETC